MMIRQSHAFRLPPPTEVLRRVKRRAAGRYALTGCCLAVIGGILLAPVSASAAYDQDGRRTGSTSIDGSYAEVTGNGFSAVSGHCVLYATLSSDSTASRQVESGVLRCNGGTLDPTTSACPGGYAYVERFNGTNFYCDSGYAITNGVAYDATTYRTGGSSTTFHGHIDGAAIDQAGFGLSDSVRGYAWGEATGGTKCPGASKGTFGSWERYDTSTGWHLVSASSLHRGVSGSMSGTPCWATISSVNSTGGFYVD